MLDVDPDPSFHFFFKITFSSYQFLPVLLLTKNFLGEHIRALFREERITSVAQDDW